MSIGKGIAILGIWGAVAVSFYCIKEMGVFIALFAVVATCCVANAK